MEPSKKDKKIRKRGAPAKTVEARENQLIDLAVSLAEEQLLKGTASAQVITHYLKLGSTKERLEKEKIVNEVDLLKAKVEALQSEKDVQKLYMDALNAMRLYSGSPEEGIEDND